MKIVSLGFTLVLSLVMFSCSENSSEVNAPEQPITETESHNHNADDSHTYSNINEINTTHLHLEMEVDFDNKSIYGVARHTMNNSGVDTAVFDVFGLEILKVTIGEDETPADHKIGTHDKVHGAPLYVAINKDTKKVNIHYKTTENSDALDWLAPELTAGGKEPYLYTQGQAILTRTWIPCQDSPKNRITYSADVKVPSQLLALMSADNPKEKNETGEYSFKMEQPIPCYLIALAVGDLAYETLGDNCGVYSEPEMVKDCANEFIDLPKMISAAEELYGEYKWGQYDIIVLPYSFPFGGMENPKLTFANPTLIAGDRSLVSVIAHELAHSWSGNLVTNATWNDFWLNEGFTVYFENRIMESIYGKETADMLSLIEYKELVQSNEEMLKGEHPEDTQLKLVLEGRNPDDGMTDIAYVKGAYFLKTLESVVGREKFDEFLNKYFTAHEFKTLTTEDFVDYLNAELLKPNNMTFNTDEWIYQNGLPNNCLQIASPRFDQVEKLADEFAAGKDITKGLTRDKYITQEWLAFLSKIPSDISPESMRMLDEKLDFKGWMNSEIVTKWYVLGIKAGYTDIRPDMRKFLVKVGRRKFLAPIYRALTESTNPEDQTIAEEVFEEAKSNYHAVSRGTINEMVYGK